MLMRQQNMGVLFVLTFIQPWLSPSSVDDIKLYKEMEKKQFWQKNLG